MTFLDFSTITTSTAPLLRNSIALDPNPEYRSRTLEPSIGSKIWKIDFLTFANVGLTKGDTILSIYLPLYLPDKILDTKFNYLIL